MRIRAFVLMTALCGVGCAKTSVRTSFVSEAPTAKPAAPTSFGKQVATVAAYTLEHFPSNFRNDCSGFVEATLARVGVPLRGSTAMFWSMARSRGWTHRRKLPRPGDLAFFDDTYDRNGNGRRDDALSHIAIVLGVSRDGTIHLAHAGTSQGRARFVMNLYQPHTTVDAQGARINDALRRRSKDGQREGTLAAELLRGFATVPDPK